MTTILFFFWDGFGGEAGPAVEAVHGWLEYRCTGRAHYACEGRLGYSASGRTAYAVSGQAHYHTKGRVHFTPSEEDV
jgi:hypothetical protein